MTGVMTTMAKSKGQKPQGETVKTAVPPAAPDVQTPPPKRESVSTKLFKLHAAQLVDLAHLEGLDSAAEAFEKHFAAALHNLVIAAATAKIKHYQDG